MYKTSLLDVHDSTVLHVIDLPAIPRIKERITVEHKKRHATYSIEEIHYVYHIEDKEFHVVIYVEDITIR